MFGVDILMVYVTGLIHMRHVTPAYVNDLMHSYTYMHSCIYIHLYMYMHS